MSYLNEKRPYTTKVCTGCKIAKNTEKFGGRSKNKDGLSTMCRVCVKLRSRKRDGSYIAPDSDLVRRRRKVEEIELSRRNKDDFQLDY